MARPTKPLALVEGHRTKSELEIRRDAELAMVTGEPLKRLFVAKEHQKAAKEFDRIKDLLGRIGKDDDLYGLMINTHCLLVEECEQIQDVRGQFIASKEELQSEYLASRIEASEYYRLLAKLSESIINCDKQLMAKRKMILDIDKENVLTVQSALRSIPKKQEDKKEKTGMEKFMARRAGV